MDSLLNIENILIELNTNKLDFIDFVDELILKYPYATFLHVLKIKKLANAGLSQTEEVTKLYNLFPQRNYIALSTKQNTIKKDLIPTIEAEKSTIQDSTNLVTTSTLTEVAIKSETAAENNFINKIEVNEIPFVLNELINKYYAANPFNSIRFLKDEEIESEVLEPINLDNKMSFSDWANLSNKIQKNSGKSSEKTNQTDIINKFLKENPRISQISENYEIKNIEFNSPEIYSIMTETLADIYVDQKKFEKAIEAYKILSLKFPEKNLYFVNKINQINQSNLKE